MITDLVERIREWSDGNSERSLYSNLVHSPTNPYEIGIMSRKTKGEAKKKARSSCVRYMFDPNKSTKMVRQAPDSVVRLRE
jgi:hypothetical protein